MAYTFELYFTGLCAFVPDDNKKECTVLLVNASDPNYFSKDLQEGSRPNIHSPVLIVPARNLSTRTAQRPPDGLLPDAEGRTLARFDLPKENIALGTEQSGSNLLLTKGPGLESFDHVIPLPEAMNAGALGLTADCLDPAIFNNVITRLTFKTGTLSNSRLARRQDNLEFDFLPYRSGFGTSTLPRRPISDFCVLRISGLTQSVTFTSSLSNSKDIVVVARSDGETVSAFFSNYDQTIQCPKSSVPDFLWYYRLFEWPQGQEPATLDRIIPWDTGIHSTSYTPDTCTCPPGNVGTPRNSTATKQLFERTNSKIETEVDSRLSILGSSVGLSRMDLSTLRLRLEGIEHPETILSTLFFATIFKGTPALGLYPECVGIRLGSAPVHASGVAIASSAVLTSAHALEPNESNYKIVVTDGTTTTEHATVGFPVLHSYADVAILFLRSELLHLDKRAAVGEGDSVAVAGLGRVDPTSLEMNTKRYGSMTIATLDIGTTDPISGASLQEMSAKPNPQSVCPTDSGGPVYLEPAGRASRSLVGLIRGPLSSAILCQGDAVLVRLEPFWTWVDQQIDTARRTGLI